MKIGLIWLLVAVCAAVGVILSGCSPKDSAPDAPPMEEATADTTAGAEEATVESAASAVVESVDAALEEGAAEVEQVAAEAEEVVEAVAEETDLQP